MKRIQRACKEREKLTKENLKEEKKLRLLLKSAKAFPMGEFRIKSSDTEHQVDLRCGLALPYTEA